MQLNEVFVAGFLGKDAIERLSAAGKAVVTLSLAYTDKYKGDDKTIWLNIVVFEPWAGTARYFKKGDNIFVKGRLTSSEWIDKKTGEKKSKIEITAFSISRLAKGDSNASAFSEIASAVISPAKREEIEKDSELEPTFDEIPF